MMTLREMVDVTLPGMLMPKEEHNELLKKLLTALADRKPPIPDSKDRVRLVMTGSLCEAPLRELLELRGSGGYRGGRRPLYGLQVLSTRKYPSLANPIEALAEAYLHMVSPCPTRIYPKLSWGHIW